MRDALPLARREDARLPAFGFQPAGVVERQAGVVADFRPRAASERVLVGPPRPFAGEVDLRERRSGRRCLASVRRRDEAFDPYPFILLNLVLSCLAALQAPFIMMSQNRQSAYDRVDAKHDYEVNVKAEIEILALHSKLDEMREDKWAGAREDEE